MEPMVYIGAGMCALSMTVAAWGVWGCRKFGPLLSQPSAAIRKLKKMSISTAGPDLPQLKLSHCMLWLLLWLC